MRIKKNLKCPRFAYFLLCGLLAGLGWRKRFAASRTILSRRQTIRGRKRNTVTAFTSSESSPLPDSTLLLFGRLAMIFLPSRSLLQVPSLEVNQLSIFFATYSVKRHKKKNCFMDIQSRQPANALMCAFIQMWHETLQTF